MMLEIKTTKRLRAYSGSNQLYQDMFIEKQRQKKKWVSVDSLKAYLLSLTEYDFYHEIGKVEVWNMSNDVVVDVTQ